MCGDGGVCGCSGIVVCGGVCVVMVCGDGCVSVW